MTQTEKQPAETAPDIGGHKLAALAYNAVSDMIRHRRLREDRSSPKQDSRKRLGFRGRRCEKRCSDLKVKAWSTRATAANMSSGK